MEYITLHLLVAHWSVMAVVWLRTRSGRLPPTKLRARAAVGLGVLCLALGGMSLGVRAHRMGSDAQFAALALTGPVYFILARDIRSRVRGRGEGQRQSARPV